MSHQRLALCLSLIVAVCLVGAFAPTHLVRAQVDKEPIRVYHAPCLGGTDAAIFSWHGVNQDGLPPVDLDRRSVDFLCVDKEVYAPYEGVVWGQVENYGGLILIDDAEHDACIIFLGMEDVAEGIDAGTVVETGDFLGLYRWHIHIAATDGACDAAHWYDRAARDLERPVAYIELGRVVPSDILQDDAIPFVSENPAR